MESAQEILQRLLDERYEAGREAGYEQALAELMNVVKGMMSGGIVEMVEGSFLKQPERVLADHPGDENDSSDDDDPPSLIDCQAPYLQKAFRHLCAHPGSTAHEAGEKLGSKGAFYTLAELGLAEKRGPQFYAKEEADGR